MKNILLILFACTIVSISAFSQTVYLADTAFATDMGYGGAEASCLAAHMAYFGWQANRAQNTWLADVFTVPADSTWHFDTIIIYGVQHNSGLTSTLLDCNLQIYDGPPGLGGSVIWGDTVTNRLGVPGSSTGFTGIYKVDTFSSIGGLDRTTEPVMYVKCYISPAITLTSGVYWLSWSLAGTAVSHPYSPNKVLLGRINPPGQQARQLYNGVWYYIVDSGKSVGMNMIIKASAGLESVATINRNQSSVLSQNVPNPFTGTTSIPFYLPVEGYTRLCVYNVVGQLVATLIDGNMSTGKHEMIYNAGDLPDGVYYYQLSTNTVNVSMQMLLIK